MHLTYFLEDSFPKTKNKSWLSVCNTRALCEEVLATGASSFQIVLIGCVFIDISLGIYLLCMSAYYATTNGAVSYFIFREPQPIKEAGCLYWTGRYLGITKPPPPPPPPVVKVPEPDEVHVVQVDPEEGLRKVSLVLRSMYHNLYLSCL